MTDDETTSDGEDQTDVFLCPATRHRICKEMCEARQEAYKEREGVLQRYCQKSCFRFVEPIKRTRHSLRPASSPAPGVITAAED